MTLLIFSFERLIIVVGETFVLFRSGIGFIFDILFSSSLIFYSTANAFPPRAFVVNIVTLYYAFRSFIFTC